MPDIEKVLAERLTPEQFKAAVADGNEVLALACAGSGKSRTLAFRIARLLVLGEKPETIVAFTFTEKAAEAIKLRVAEALKAVGIPETVLGAMYIGTIHSYCQRVLGDMDAKYRQFDVLDENRLKLYLISRYPALELKKVRDGHQAKYFDTIREVSDGWKTVNDELIEIPDVQKRDPVMGTALTTLSQSLQEAQFIDFSSMIRLVVDALRVGRPEAKRAVGELRHLIVDEYQDVNPSQEALISELHKLGGKLFVVGDDDQAIYGWRGADVSQILTFKTRYPSADVHTLPKNFRSTPAIVTAADDFISAELGAKRISKDPEADPPESPRDFRKLWFDARLDEAEWVSERIRGLLSTAHKEKDGTIRGLTPADFAILMRSTRQPEQNDRARHCSFTEALKKRDIPYSLESGGGVFDRPQVGALVGAFSLIRDGNPRREVVENFFNASIRGRFPAANLDRVAYVIADWGRKVHPPAGLRQRLFPQQFLYQLLEALGVESSNFDPGTMQDIGLFSRILQDVETVYLSIDSPQRFAEVLNFLENVADTGYDTSTQDVLRRPDAVTVSTVHRMKGLEFPVVFVVDVEAQRFPKRQEKYRGWLPDSVIKSAIQRGAYTSNPDEEARLFYTAITRAERFLYVTGSTNVPGGRKARKPSSYFLRLQHDELSTDAASLPSSLTASPQKRRVDETVVPTSFSEIHYFLRCPKDYQFRHEFGFSPPITEMFGFGRTVHTTVEKLHELFPKAAPSGAEAADIVGKTFHLKHVARSVDPKNRPGPYERAKDRAISVAQDYVKKFGKDFAQERAVEVTFEIPVRNAVIQGAIDLLLKIDENQQIIEATVVDFKTIEGGDEPAKSPDIEWTDLSLQVQLYANAAREVLSQNAKTGSVHFLKDNQRVDVPVSDDAIAAAIGNVEWAVERIIDGDFPMRPHPEKCGSCDFRQLCRKKAETFKTNTLPPAIQTPTGPRMALAFRQFQDIP